MAIGGARRTLIWRSREVSSTSSACRFQKTGRDRSKSSRRWNNGSTRWLANRGASSRFDRARHSGRLQVSVRGRSILANGIRSRCDIAGWTRNRADGAADRGSAGERIDWETTGLLPAAAGTVAALPAIWRDTGGDLYRVIGPRFDATARIRQSAASAPQVHLADLRATVHPGRRLSVVAILDSPAGRCPRCFVHTSQEVAG